MKIMTATSKIFAILTFLSVLVWKLDCVCVDCYLSPNATDEEVERFLILDFKQRLMERLGLKTEPKFVTSTPDAIIDAISSSQIMAGDQANTESSEEPNKISNIVFGPYAASRITKNRYLFKFQILSKIKGSYELDGVKIWLPASKASTPHRFQIYDRTWKGRRLLLNDTITSINSFSSNSEWKYFKIMPNKNWYRAPWKPLHLEIEGIVGEYNVLPSKDQPQLEVQTRPIKKRRVYKRNTRTTDCPNDGRCCKHTMRLNLKGHIPWLVMPDTIQALVCRGTCPILHRSRWLWSVLAQMQQLRKPCCVPTKLLPISVIQRVATRTGTELVASEVSDMRVASCGCA